MTASRRYIVVANTAPVTALSLKSTIQTTDVWRSAASTTRSARSRRSTPAPPRKSPIRTRSAPARCPRAGTSWIFAAESSDSGTVHLIGGDTHARTYTAGGGVSFTASGHF
jgi:hypothetical protein